MVQFSRSSIETPLRVERLGARKYLVQLPPGVAAELSELFLQIDDEGDTGMAFIHRCGRELCKMCRPRSRGGSSSKARRS